MTGSKGHVTIIGAGIVGVSCAAFLQREGFGVTVVDRLEPGLGTSFGNAGSVSPSAILPVAMPGVMKKIPGWLMDPLGPLTVRWSYLPWLAPWLWRFFAASTPARVEQISRELSSLVAPAGEAHKALMKAHRIEGIVKPLGWLKVYSGEASFRSTLEERLVMQKLGVNLQLLNQDELRQLEPGLAPNFTHGAFQPDNLFVTSPVKLAEAYAEAFTRLGGSILAEKAVRFERDGNRVSRVVTDLAIHEAEHVVICAGAWSGRVCEMLGVRVPLDTERGYHLNLVQREDGPKLTRPVVIGDHGFVLAPMQDGIRLTSGVEFAGVDAAPDFTRIRRMLPLAQKALPGLSANVTREWLGHRPSTPDSKPVIGSAPGLENVFLGFGHGHIGLTLAARTADLLAARIAGRPADIDLTPFAAGRF